MFYNCIEYIYMKNFKTVGPENYSLYLSIYLSKIRSACDNWVILKHPIQWYFLNKCVHACILHKSYWNGYYSYFTNNGILGLVRRLRSLSIFLFSVCFNLWNLWWQLTRFSGYLTVYKHTFFLFFCFLNNVATLSSFAFCSSVIYLF